MVRDLQMGIQWRKGKQSRTAVRVDAGEQGEERAPVEARESEVGLSGIGRSILERMRPIAYG